MGIFGLFLMGYWACCSRNLVAATTPCNYSAQTCGNISIPYPFGMSSECGLQDYRISCNPSYGAGRQLPFLQVGTVSTPELQVLEFSTNTITVNSTQLKAMATSEPSTCHDQLPLAFPNVSFELSSSGPFVLSDSNMFAVIGCSASGTLFSASSTTEGYSVQCGSGCYNQWGFPFCNGYACCVNAIPPTSRLLQFNGSGDCGFSTVLSPSTYSVERNQDGGSFLGAGEYGLLISWALMVDESSKNCSMCSENTECLPNNLQPAGYNCNCTEGYRGDGYKEGIGCQDIDECAEGLDICEPPPFGKCTNTMGSFHCNCTSGSTGNGLLGNCTTIVVDSAVVLPAILGGLAGAFILTLLIIICYASRRAYRMKQQRKDNFHRNGGAELRSMLFSEDELRRATKNFSREHELGKGGYGTVYWGNLPNHGKVAIKKAKHMEDADREEDQMKSFVSEILLLGKTTHENVVRLLGCCVETRVPLLVYEFVENGTLWDHLHPGKDYSQRSTLGSSWAKRLHIALDTAKALTYLHKMSPPILHRDIKSTNILLDKSYNPKVADFGASRFLPSGATHLTFAAVVGTPGYLDPEYHLSCQFTDKSDVYSFGVILLELITSMPADLGTKVGTLAHHFRTSFRPANLAGLIDPRLSTTANVLASIQDIGELAIQCLAMEGHQRPSMEVVLGKVKGIQSKRTLMDEVMGSYNQGSSASAEHYYMRTNIIWKQSAGNKTEERESTSLLSTNWTPSQEFTTSTSTTSEIALT